MFYYYFKQVFFSLQNKIYYKVEHYNIKGELKKMNIYAGTYNGQVYMLSGHPTNIQVKRRNQISETSIRALYLPENSSQLLSGGFDGEMTAINKFTLQTTKQIKQPLGMINCIQKVSQHVVALGHQNGLLRFWDWKSWSLKKQLRQHKKPIRDFCIDKNQILFFSVANKGLILWNTKNYEKVFHYKFDYEIEQVLIDSSLQFILLINQKQIHQIKAETNEEVALYKIQTAQFIQTAIMFQDYLIIGGDKGNINIYSLGHYEHKISFQAHKLRVKALKIIHYDQIDYLITASSNGQISVWDILQFLKEVQKISQDYQLNGLQPLCSVNLNLRVICIEVGLIQTNKAAQKTQKKQNQIKKNKANQQIISQKKDIQSHNQTKQSKKSFKNQQKGNKKLPSENKQVSTKITNRNKQKKIEKNKKKKLLLQKKLKATTFMK